MFSKRRALVRDYNHSNANAMGMTIHTTCGGGNHTDVRRVFTASQDQLNEVSQ
eukprot:m.255266 g.255266  ORF g.255266 m.255266 type:complete len:53 (-) comp33927_c0_seq11:73-231(-)